ncbi:protein scarlet-like isoform X1 [Rhopalosiphum maidis]|uniref:protein scarlet-like isoform X1 n=1 Tax=Rhopalosiphum maidis TaxID=43146 RepID=UPI000F007E81|nr:protein scarlet-like isoform X1 [Rhopalosiphum maidis]
MFGTKLQRRTLDLRYNEMWNDWDSTAEHQMPKKYVHGHLVLSWKKINVHVKQTTKTFFRGTKTSYKQILHNVSGNVQCGNLLGIMGPSGSGKTTLMATISHRTKGNFEGELLLNGRPISEEVMIKISGFVPQHDISFDQLTALEHLSLMANLKVSRKTTKIELKEHIDEIVSTLGMTKFLNTRISFLSGGERKKIALAVQLLNNPPILFCDEITTGLDSYSAAHIVNTLKNVARMGKIVICTIHQPASGVFGKFDDVLLLSNGLLAYQGPVTMVHQLFQKFNYECPDMFNEADFVISILNSENEKVKENVKEMCKLTSSDQQMDLNYDLFNDQTKYDPQQLETLETLKPTWATQFNLVFNRSIKCFARNYKNHLLELGTIWFLGVIISAPFANLQFDTKAVQNWEGFWLIFVINYVFHFSYSAIPLYQVKFAIVHREIHNKVYPLSTYFLSELVIAIFWIMIKMLFYCVSAFWIVGADQSSLQLLAFYLLAFAAYSYGSLLSAYFTYLENTMIFATLYDFLSLPLSGAYLSFMSLPKVIYSLRYFSLFFLGCEAASVLFWDRIKSLPCVDVTNCLDSGKAVLRKYGYISSELYSDMMILALVCILTNIFGYFRVLKKMKKQPAY